MPALHVAEALSGRTQGRRISVNGVPFFEVKNGERILVCSALGHLYCGCSERKWFEIPISRLGLLVEAEAFGRTRAAETGKVDPVHHTSFEGSGPFCKCVRL